MLDLQGVVFMKDDSLDDQLQDGLPLGDAGRQQPGAHAFAKRAQARQSFLTLEPLLS